MQFEAGPRPSMADTACETEATGSQSEQNHSAASDDSSGARHLQLECTNRNNQSAHGQSVTQPAQFNETRPLEHVTSLTEGQTRPIPKHSSSSSPVPPPKSPTLEPTNRDPPPAYHQLDDSHSEPVHTESAGPLPGVECADYRFVYMGPAGSWTPCHADVLRSYSWSANVCGRKRWRLLPPDQAWMLLDRWAVRETRNLPAR